MPLPLDARRIVADYVVHYNTARLHSATRQTPHDATVDLCNRLGIALPILANTWNGEEEPVAPEQPTSTMPPT